MEKMTFYESTRVVPPEAQKSIGGGRLKGMTDINPMWRIKKLTELFGPAGIGWVFKVIDHRMVPGAQDQVAVFVDVELRYKDGDVWSEPVYGTGGSMFIAKEAAGLYTDDEAYKKAYTDAQSVACKALGIGADVYWQKDATKYTEKEAGKITPVEKNAPAEAPMPNASEEPQESDDILSQIAQTKNIIFKLGLTKGLNAAQVTEKAVNYVESKFGALVEFADMNLEQLTAVKLKINTLPNK